MTRYRVVKRNRRETDMDGTLFYRLVLEENPKLRTNVLPDLQSSGAQSRHAAKGRVRSAPTADGEDIQHMLAFSIRQPWAELIMRGEKKEEFRTLRTNIRGRVGVYAGEGRYPKEDEEQSARDYQVELDPLPRGVLVGTVEITGCVENEDGMFAWKLAHPRRLREMLKPRNHPQPRFFYPFDKPQQAAE